MFKKYTDLAIETRELSSSATDEIGKTRVCGVPVSCFEAEECGGTYWTTDIGRVWEMTSDERKKRSKAIAVILNKLCPSDGGCVLVAGIGNRGITCDSVGALVADGVIVTRHIKKLGRRLYDSIGFGDVACISPGVMGQTGIECRDIISGVIGKIHPAVVIAVDALAARRLSRLCTTVQISDVGIRPGTGVGNGRTEISRSTLGVPVVSIGVPTVVDAATLAGDLVDELGVGNDAEELLNALRNGSGNGLFVSPKDSDIIIREVSRIISDGINLAFHKNIPYEDINEYRTV